VAAAANTGGTGWTLDVTGAQTLAWRTGNLRYTAYATHKTTARLTVVDAGLIAVTASPMATSPWTAVVAACDAALLSGTASGVISFGVDGISQTYSSRDQLISMRNNAREKELRDTGNHPARIVRARFT
jgi:hypothetical protein